MHEGDFQEALQLNYALQAFIYQKRSLIDITFHDQSSCGKHV